MPHTARTNAIYERSPEREAKIDRVLAHRQPGLTLVIENIHDQHNFNAILRSCDAVGVERVHLVYTIEKAPALHRGSSMGTHKWLDFEHHESMASCYERLREEGYQILATKLEPTARPLYDFDLARPTAFVMGNEHRGISAEAEAGADSLLYIPMMGMAESVNVSVAAAVCLFESSRQRHAAGLYEQPQLSENALRSKKAEWLSK